MQQPRHRSRRPRVYASYGMTETSSQIAHAQVTPSFDGGLRLLPGYEARIVDPDAQGFGRLAVKGPGVFEGYLNARAAHTVDGFFLTGDTAALAAGRLYVKERTSDMFVSGGENVYPAEIRDKLVRVPGVAEAYVFGAPDAVWGRRPVAFVERERLAAPQRTEPVAPQQFAATVRASLSTRLSKLYQPRCLFALDEFPRTGIGKIDRAALQALYEQRIEVARVTLYRIRLPFLRPFKTARGILRDRESVIVEVEDHAGRTGLGECVAFPTDWYLPETLDQDVRVLKEVLAPLVLNEAYLHPSAQRVVRRLRGGGRVPVGARRARAGAVGPVRQDSGQAAVEAHRRCGAPRGSRGGPGIRAGGRRGGHGDGSQTVASRAPRCVRRRATTG